MAHEVYKNWIIFFDDGGVMNDNKLREPQWRELVGKWFSSRFGGKRSSWQRANSVALRNEMKFIYDLQQGIVPMNNYTKMREQMDYAWVSTMFKEVGIKPPNFQAGLEIGREAIMWIAPQVLAAFPGIINVIKTLATKYQLHTASNEESYMLDAYLQGMGVRDCFGTLFGVDLVNYFKVSKIYYEKIFSELNIEPSQAIIIEDNPRIVKLIENTGAIAIQSCLTGEFDPVTEYSFANTQLLLPIISDIVQD